ncbi:MAG: hypothetical protein LBJ02_02195 [Bifidobacteriaceae bacterium]|jgi:hypothetical protein|nr:hypothetical protein [Bifidobacteriaceae bacterium]
MSPDRAVVAVDLLIWALGSMSVWWLRVLPAKFGVVWITIATPLAILSDWYPTSLVARPAPWLLGALVLAVLPVAVGLAEAKLRANGEAIYPTNREHVLDGHLLTNLAGALILIILVSVLHKFGAPFTDYLHDISWGKYFAPLLSFSALVAIVFVSFQQRDEGTEAVGEADATMNRKQRRKARQGLDPKVLVKTSLRNPNQIANVIWLTAVMAYGGRSAVYMLAFLHNQQRGGDPVELPWWMVPALIGILGFFFACAISKKLVIYITFLTATPVAITIEFAVLSLYASSPTQEAARLLLPLLSLGAFAAVVSVTLRRVDTDRRKPGPFGLAAALLCLAGYIALWVIW